MVFECNELIIQNQVKTGRKPLMGAHKTHVKIIIKSNLYSTREVPLRLQNLFFKGALAEIAALQRFKPHSNVKSTKRKEDQAKKAITRPSWICNQTLDCIFKCPNWDLLGSVCKGQRTEGWTL